METHPSIQRPLRLVLLLVCALANGLGVFPAMAGDYWVFFGTATGPASKGIYVSRMDETGKLTAPVLAAETPNPTFLAVKPAPDPLLFAANEIGDFNGQKSGAVSAFAVDTVAGELRFLNQQPSGGEGPCHVSIAAGGKVVLAANYTGGSVVTFPVDAEGHLGSPGSFIQNHGSSVNPSRQQGPHAHCIIPSPDNRFVFVCDLGLDQILRYRLDPARGTLTPSDPPFVSVTPGSGPRHITFGPSNSSIPNTTDSKGTFGYLLNEMGCTIDVFGYDAPSGNLSRIQSLSALPPDKPVQPSYTAAEIVVHPSNKFLYASVRGPDVISVFRIDSSSGRLTLIDSIPSGGKTPRNFNIDPSGRFLLAANQNSDSVVVFGIDQQTGRLSPTGQTLALGKPMCVVFVPVPNRQYAAPGNMP